ncbi:diiron oxygenase [Kitasatospora sp. NPDC048296]|uniref:diiron oxygenase n=1 Tax=Kitasatospora sp. NPDC048296 TaxID=3364048 RepID=UPI003717635E
MTNAVAEASFHEVLERLSEKSSRDFYNPYTKFSWPEAMAEGDWWMNPELLSVHGTGLVTDETSLKALARRETVNFFSLHVHGIRELMSEVARRIHTPRFAEYSGYLHHFIGEENAHMWFFAEFCNRYAGGVYPEPASPLATKEAHGAWGDLLVFARILIFEEIFDYFNARLGRDPLLPEILRELHAAHHHDESRHVAFGKKFVKHLFDLACAEDQERGHDGRAGAEEYIKAYMTYSVQSLYNPRAYREAGIVEPLTVRRTALRHPVREEFHHRVMARVDRFFVAGGIFTTPWGALDGAVR